MLGTRGVVRTARSLTVCLIALLVCPAAGQIAAFASANPVACSSAHACCRRAAMSGACPHQMAMAEHGRDCRGAVCVLTCNNHGDDGIVPVLMIGFSPVSMRHAPRGVATGLPVISIDAARSAVRLPPTPPPRQLAA